MGKKYFWLKLKEDFFRQIYVKKLRRLDGGDALLVIYLKMLLASLREEGRLTYDGDFVEDLALDLDEDETQVRTVVEFLESNSIIEHSDAQCGYVIPSVKEDLISETESASRVRKSRAKKDVSVTAPLQCNARPLHCNTHPLQCNTEIEIEKEIELDIDNAAARACKLYEQSVGTINNYLAERIAELVQKTGWPAFEKACQKAVNANARSFNYIEKAAMGIASGDDFDAKRKHKNDPLAAYNAIKEDDDIDKYGL